MKHLQFRQSTHAEKIRWEEELIRQYKYNDRHKPAGSPNNTGGEFDVKPGGGGGVPPSGERPGFRRIGQVADNLHNPVQNDVGGGAPTPPRRAQAEDVRSILGSTVVDNWNSRQPSVFDPGYTPPKKVLNVDVLIKHLRDNATGPNVPRTLCAQKVRLGLAAGNITVQIPPVRNDNQRADAQDYWLPLMNAGFEPVIGSGNAEGGQSSLPSQDYKPERGDVAVFRAHAPTKRDPRPSGHMQVYAGRTDAGKDVWISYFVQKSFWPGAQYAQERPPYVIFRYPNRK